MPDQLTDADWIDVRHKLPPDEQEVETMLCDETGTRNRQILKRRGRLWFFHDGEGYVYYVPTHWRQICNH